MREFILAYLHAHAISQSELADALGVSKQYLSDYLLGKSDSVKLELDIIDWVAARSNEVIARGNS